jgi:hypothetical protein
MARLPSRWDFFIAYSGRDASSADQLCRLLNKHRAKVFLDKTRLTPGSQWDLALKRAIANSRIIVALISRHTSKAWYQRDEIAIAIKLVRRKESSYSIVPVRLEGARDMDVPYGLNHVHCLLEADLGFKGIAQKLVDELERMKKRAKKRPVTIKLAHSVARMDDIWSGMGPVLQNKQRGVPKEFRVRYVTAGNDLVMRDRRKALIRITPGQFKKKLTPSNYDHVETLEQSMDLNYSLWKREYPRRTVSRASKAKVTKAATAMAEDFAGILDTLVDGGFWLDDHYGEIRRIVAKLGK